jgi:hypothetical protein
MNCNSPDCVYLVNSNSANKFGAYCCGACKKSSGKNHGNLCERASATANIYTQNIPAVNAASGLQIWNKAQIDNGLILSPNYKKTTQDKIITISGSLAEIQDVISRMGGDKLPESETDTYQATGNMIRFTDRTNKTLAIWSEVTYNEESCFYIVTACADPSAKDPVLVLKV